MDWIFSTSAREHLHLSTLNHNTSYTLSLHMILFQVQQKSVPTKKNTFLSSSQSTHHTKTPSNMIFSLLTDLFFSSLNCDFID